MIAKIANICRYVKNMEMLFEKVQSRLYLKQSFSSYGKTHYDTGLFQANLNHNVICRS